MSDPPSKFPLREAIASGIADELDTTPMASLLYAAESVLETPEMQAIREYMAARLALDEADQWSPEGESTKEAFLAHAFNVVAPAIDRMQAAKDRLPESVIQWALPSTTESEQT